VGAFKPASTKGGARNALAQAFFSIVPGELRDRGFRVAPLQPENPGRLKLGIRSVRDVKAAVGDTVGPDKSFGQFRAKLNCLSVPLLPTALLL
jgi:hypothetical protein